MSRIIIVLVPQIVYKGQKQRKLHFAFGVFLEHAYGMNLTK